MQISVTLGHKIPATESALRVLENPAKAACSGGTLLSALEFLWTRHYWGHQAVLRSNGELVGRPDSQNKCDSSFMGTTQGRAGTPLGNTADNGGRSTRLLNTAQPLPDRTVTSGGHSVEGQEGAAALKGKNGTGIRGQDRGRGDLGVS